MFTNSFVPSAEKDSDPPLNAHPERSPAVEGPKTSSAGVMASGLSVSAAETSDDAPPIMLTRKKFAVDAMGFAPRSHTNARYRGGAADAGGAGGVGVAVPPLPAGVPTARGGGAIFGSGTALSSKRNASFACFSSHVNPEYRPGPPFTISAEMLPRGLTANTPFVSSLRDATAYTSSLPSRVRLNSETSGMVRSVFVAMSRMRRSEPYVAVGAVGEPGVPGATPFGGKPNFPLPGIPSAGRSWCRRCRCRPSRACDR